MSEKKKPMIEKLIAAFKAAKAAALAADPGEGFASDAGTCNCDTPGFFLKRVPLKKIEAAASEAGVSVYETSRWGGRYFFLNVPLFGQADRRATMMEAAQRELKNLDGEIQGFRASGWYAMD